MSSELIAVAGAKDGDEGKGKVIDALVSQGVDVCIKGQGGPNAGHTVVQIIESKEVVYAFHSLPSAILDPNVDCILGQGVLLNPTSLIAEINGVEKRGISTSKLIISPSAHLITPVGQLFDEIEEERKGGQKIGTTKQGMGPTSADKYARFGLRADLLRYPEELLNQLEPYLEYKRKIYQALTGQDPTKKAELDIDYYAELVPEWSKRLGPQIASVEGILSKHFSQGHRILVEGNQGTMLRIGSEDYPFVTSSETTIGGMIVGSGIPVSWIKSSDYRAILVQKAIDSKVGSGPFVTKMPSEMAELFQDETEIGVTSGRIRSVGFFDGVKAEWSNLINCPTEIAVPKMDVLKGKGEMSICEAYELDGRRVEEYPDNSRDLIRCKPIYSDRVYTFDKDVRGVQSWDSLGPTEQAYLNHIMEFYPGARLSMIGTGRSTEDMIYL